MTIQRYAHRAIDSPKQAYALWLALSERKRNGIWEEVGYVCGLTAKQVHDKWHNQISKQFCDDVAPFKGEIKQWSEKFKHMEMKLAIKAVISALEEEHKEKHFHYQTVYHLAKSQIKALQMKQQDPATQRSLIEEVTQDPDRIPFAFAENAPCSKTVEHLLRMDPNDIRVLESLLKMGAVAEQAQ